MTVGIVRVALVAAPSSTLLSLRSELGRHVDVAIVAEWETTTAMPASGAAVDCNLTLVALPHGEAAHACATLKTANDAARVVVLGTTDGSDEMVAAVEAGADGYVGATYAPDDLVTALRRVAGGEAWIPPAMLGALLGSLIRRRRVQNAASERLDRLTKRERQILQWLADGMGRQAIADASFVSPNTVRTHVQNMLKKLEVHSQAEAVQLITDAGIDGPPGR